MKEKIAAVLGKELGTGKDEILKMIEVPPNHELGDYAFPCFSLAGKFRKNPSEIAKELAGKIKLLDGIEKVKATGAYLNFFLDKKEMAEEVLKRIDENYGKSQRKNYKIVIDFSAPNIGKPMHIGHIRSTIIGDSLMRISDFLGFDAIGINYLGDIGLHIGKLIVAYELWLDKKELEKNPVNELLRLYVKFCELEKTEYNEGVDEQEQDNEWSNKAKEKLKLLELGDKKTHNIWQEIRKASESGFNRVYKMLNVNFHETTGQSLFSEKGKEIIKEALKKKLAKKEDGGAVYVEFDDLPKKYILRSNGTASYITQDIGAAVSRYEKYKFDKMIYVTDFRQELHFKQLFAILKKFGYNFYNKLEHLGFGTINFGNEIMATRKGKVILLEEVLNKTIEKVKEEVRKRKTKGDSEKIGVAAIKYAILKNNPEQDVNFSWEQALNFEGNTGPYLLYTYARASSIIRKAGNRTSKIKIDKIEDKEAELVKELEKFPEIIKQAYNGLSPSLIANYAYELARKFNEFYHSSQVIGSKEEDFRLSLVEATRKVLKKSLFLLGIEAIEEM